MSRAKKISRSRPQKVGSRLAAISLSILAFLVLVGLVVNLITRLHGAYLPDSPTPSRSYQWDGKSTFNVVIKSEELFVLSYNPIKETGLVLKFPGTTYLNLAFGFGDWPTRSIYSLGQAENPPLGALLLKQTISQTLGVPVDGYIIVGKNTTLFGEDEINMVRSNPLKALNLIWDSKSDLTPWELITLWWGVREIRSDKFKVLDLGQSQLTRSLLLPDGSRALGLDQSKLDQFVGRSFEDSNLSLEGLSIGVFNSTDHPQLAEKAARMLTVLGGRTIFVSNSRTAAKKSVVVGKDSYTKRRVTEIFSAENSLLPTLEPSRAEITIFLGEDYFKSFNR